MSDRRSSFRLRAVVVIRRVLLRAPKLRRGTERTRRALREAFGRLVRATPEASLPLRPRAVWYAAIRDVTGGGVRQLRDPRQLPLFDLGASPRTRRARRSSPGKNPDAR